MPHSHTHSLLNGVARNYYCYFIHGYARSCNYHAWVHLFLTSSARREKPFGLELESNPGPLASQATALTTRPFSLGLLNLYLTLFYCRLHEEVLVTAGLDGIVGIFQILGTELLTLRLLQVQVTAFLFNLCLSFILVKANFYSADNNFSMSHVRASFLFYLCSAMGRSLNSWKCC